MTTAPVAENMYQDLEWELEAICAGHPAEVSKFLTLFHKWGWRSGADALIDRYQGKAAAANRALEPLQAENQRLRKQITALTNSADRVERQVSASGIVYALQDLQAQIKASRKMLES